MDRFTFLHAADIHLDSPLLSLVLPEPSQGERVRRACRDSFENLVNMAIERKVAFVVLAGDLYDRDAPNMQVAVFLRNQLARLEKHDIRVVIIKGNHDADNRITSGLALPANTHIFSDRKPETVTYDHLPVRIAIHGQSFMPGPVTDNLAMGYPTPTPDSFNIGVLHTSVAGNPDHDPYAPCKLEDLTTRGYDYWALGHIHKSAVLCQDPWVVFPGNLQGRHAKETGPKGCVLVNVEDGRVKAVEAIDLAVVRWHAAEIDLAGALTETDLIERLRKGLAGAMQDTEGRPSAVRVRLYGTTELFDLIEGRPQRLLQTLLELAGETAGDDLWIEKIMNDTTPVKATATLNVLLSFAQFEREVTGERIRDKIAASKKKGMWMGGYVPLGYRAEKRTLVIDHGEAKAVCQIYDLYLRLRSVKAVRAEASQLGFRTRPTAAGHSSPLSRGHIYRLLTNPIYMGKISHKGLLSNGLHDPIIESKTWEKVQKLLIDGSARDRDQPNIGEQSPLAGIIFDHKGERLTPSHAVKGGRRYRYYISQSLVTDRAKPDGIRLSAPEVEGAVAAAMRNLLNDPAQVEKLLGSHAPTLSELKQLIAKSQEWVTGLNRKPASDQLMILRPVLSKVIIGNTDLSIDIKPQQLAELSVKPDAALPERSYQEDICPDHRMVLPMRLGRRGNETRLIIQLGTQQRPVDHKLLNLIARGFVWREELFTGAAESASDIGDRDGISRPYVSRLIDLSFLAPDIIAAIADGTAPAELSSEKLQSIDALPLGWASQRVVLGFGR